MIGVGAIGTALFLALLPEVQTLPWEYLPGGLFRSPAALVYEPRPGPESPDVVVPDGVLPDGVKIDVVVPDGVVPDEVKIDEVVADGVAETKFPPARSAPVVESRLESRQATDSATTLSGPPVASPVPVKRTAPVRPPGLYLDGLLWRQGGEVRAAWINGRLWEGQLPAPRGAPLAGQMNGPMSGPVRERDVRGPSPSPILRLPGWEKALRVGQGWPGGPRSGASVRDPMSLGIRGPCDRGGRP